MEWSKIIGTVVILSIILYILPSLFEGGKFDVSNISNLKDKISPIWKITLLGLGSLAAYTFIFKQKEKAAYTKKDVFQLVVVVVILYLLWSNVLSPDKIDILTKSTASVMNAVGALP